MKPVKPCYIIGIMSGTSMDGVDAVLARMEIDQPKQVATAFIAYDDDFRSEMLALNVPGSNEIHRAAVGANDIAHLYADAVAQVLKKAGLRARDITAIGAHGQTVRHRPELGYTVQLLNGALLAEKTGIRTICDFRARDIAAGGQGAPLVPAFHANVFGNPDITRVILNLGGIANVTALQRGSNEAFGFDTGPANVFLDHWCERHLGQRYDGDGEWARTGHVLADLLEAMLADPYFAAPPPKSTGRDLFSPAWLAQFRPDTYSPADVQATLLALTVRTVADAIKANVARPDEILVCGGGALNAALLQGLRDAMGDVPVLSASALGMDPMSVEALAFAWLAWRTLEGQAGNLPSATGARGLRVLGAIHG